MTCPVTDLFFDNVFANLEMDYSKSNICLASAVEFGPSRPVKWLLRSFLVIVILDSRRAV